ncbi:hypothetical protein [Photobacterium sp. WH24]|uniref:hypothetical protein n=1 Tax=Photobacterium sp. WH24 TaxID=2827237 RepID=UPI001C43C8AB|nr:hypothetical protein [Photobacterium sp. WH24]
MADEPMVVKTADVVERIVVNNPLYLVGGTGCDGIQDFLFHFFAKMGGCFIQDQDWLACPV